MLKHFLNGKIDREFGSVSSQEQAKFLTEIPNLHEYNERALQGECTVQRRSAETEIERDRMIMDKSNSDGATMYGINSQLQSQQSELHHANQWACQAQMECRKMSE